MEITKDQASNSAGGSLLRYPLRSVTKVKETIPPSDESNAASVARRVRATPYVAKSMCDLDLSGKSISSTKRFTNITKSANNPNGIPSGYLTPSSDNRKSSNSQLNNDTPISDASKSSHRRKFCVLSSASYWLSQIKLSESASKHLVSIGFFRLALDSGVEPLHRIREELKSYVLKHNLLEEFENATKDLLNGYNIHEDLEKLQISDSSQLSEDVSQNSVEAVKLSAIVPRARNLKPKFQNINTLAESNKKEPVQRTPSTRKSSLRNLENAALANDSHGNPRKLQASNAKNNSKLTEKSLDSNEVDDSPNEEPKLDDKENLGVEDMDAYSTKEANQAN